MVKANLSLLQYFDQFIYNLQRPAITKPSPKSLSGAPEEPSVIFVYVTVFQMYPEIIMQENVLEGANQSQVILPSPCKSFEQPVINICFFFFCWFDLFSSSICLRSRGSSSAVSLWLIRCFSRRCMETHYVLCNVHQVSEEQEENKEGGGGLTRWKGREEEKEKNEEDE